MPACCLQTISGVRVKVLLGSEKGRLEANREGFLEERVVGLGHEGHVRELDQQKNTWAVSIGKVEPIGRAEGWSP